MPIPTYYGFILAVCIIVIGMLVQLWYFYGVITDTEYGLVLAVYTVLVLVLLSQVFHTSHLMGPLDAGRDAMICRLRQTHARHLKTLKHEHDGVALLLKQVNDQLKSKMDSMQVEYDIMTGLYQDQMRTLQERDARVTYLEGKLNESGRRYSTSNAAATTTMAPPYSAPAGQMLFSDLPFGFDEDEAVL